jgi:hypothetical protein
MILDRYPGAPAATDASGDQADTDHRRLRGLRALGYWAPGSSPDLPRPHDFVDASWSSNERDAVFAYLHLGEMILPWKGYAWCRFGCGLVEQPFPPITHEDLEQMLSDTESPPRPDDNRPPAAPASLAELVRRLRAEPDTLGSTCLSDGHFIWPQGLAHYVDKHSVRPPDEFVHHALRELSRRGIT